MTMTKLVSLRIDERALAALDEHMKRLPYWKRHAIMVNLLENVLLSADYNTIRTILNHWQYSSKKLIFDVKETKE